MKTKKINKFIALTYKGDDIVRETPLLSTPLTIGSSYLSDITIKEATKEKTLFLKHKSKNIVQFTIPEGVSGSINKKGSKVTFKALVELGLARKQGSAKNPSFVIDITRDSGTWIEIESDESKVTCKFKEEEVWVLKKPGLKRLEILFISCVALSALLHISLTNYMSSREVAEVSQIEALKKLPERFARLVLAPKPKPKIEKKVEVKEDPEEVPEEKEEKDKPKEDKKKPKPEKKPKRKKPVSKELQKRVSSKGLLGVIGATGGLMSTVGSSDWNKMDTLIESSTKTKIADAGSVLDNIDSAEVEDIQIDLAGQTKKEARSKKDIIEEKEENKIVSKKMKPKDSKASAQRDESQVYSKITSYIGGLKYLYNNRLRTNPTLEGSITVLITINPDGTVSSSSLKNSTLQDVELENKILKRIKRWKFVPLESGKPYTISYTFDFSPIN